MVLNNYLVEFIISGVFVFIILATGNPLAIGASLALIILITQGMTYGMMNPMVTIVMASAGQIPVNDIVPYVIAQIMGGLVGLEVYKRYGVSVIRQ